MADINNSLGQNTSGGGVWGSITGNILNQLDLTTYLEENYYPLDLNPNNYLTIDDLPPQVLQDIQSVLTEGNIVTDLDLNFVNTNNLNTLQLYSDGIYLNDNLFNSVTFSASELNMQADTYYSIVQGGVVYVSETTVGSFSNLAPSYLELGYSDVNPTIFFPDKLIYNSTDYFYPTSSTSTIATLEDINNNIPSFQSVIEAGDELVADDNLRKIVISKEGQSISFYNRADVGDAWSLTDSWDSPNGFIANGGFLNGIYQLYFNTFGGIVVSDVDNNSIQIVPNGIDKTVNGTTQYTSIWTRVVYSNETAENNTNYTVVANATFTDPTPSEGAWFSAIVRNGTATIGGTAYGVGTLVYRVYHSGAWSNTVFLDQTQIGSATQTALDKKVTFWGSGNNGTTVANTLTITPTYSQLIPANTFEAGDVVIIQSRATAPGTKTSASSLIAYVNTADNLSGATQIGVITPAATSRTPQLKRTLSIKGSTTKVAAPTTTSLTDDFNAPAAMASLTIDWTVDQYIIFAISHTVADQTLTGDMYTIQKL